MLNKMFLSLSMVVCVWLGMKLVYSQRQKSNGRENDEVKLKIGFAVTEDDSLLLTISNKINKTKIYIYVRYQ